MQFSRCRRVEKRSTFRYLATYAYGGRRCAFPPYNIVAASIRRSIIAGTFLLLSGITDVLAQTPVRLDPPPALDKSAYTLFNPTPDSALRTFSPDRPTRSNGPLTVDAGRFQYETDVVSYTHSNVGGVSTRTFVALDPTLKVGLTSQVDLELQFNGYTSTRVLDPSTGSTLAQADGAGDLVIRTKVNLFGNDSGAVALALIPFVKLPTAAPTLGNNEVEGGVIAPLSIKLPAGFVLTLVTEVDVLRNANDNGKHTNFVGVLDLGYAITDHLTVFAEVYGAAGTDAYTPPAYTADAAVAYLLTEMIQLDAGINVGLNRDTPNLQLYSGISQRF